MIVESSIDRTAAKKAAPEDWYQFPLFSQCLFGSL